MAGARRSRWKPIATAAACALGIALLGALTTDIGPWYRSLNEPTWKPPDALFGPAWTTIFALAAIAGVIAWQRATSRSQREWILILFAANGFLNVLWSLLFFRLHRPDWALAEVGFLWLSIVALIVHLGRFSRPSGWLLTPYLAWVSFANRAQCGGGATERSVRHVAAPRHVLAGQAIVDAALAVVALEVIVLAVYRRLTRRGLTLPSILANAAAGAFLMLAFRSLLAGSGGIWLAACFAAAGAAHLADLVLRWKAQR